MEKLADTGSFRCVGFRVHFGKSDPCKPGGGGEVSRKSESAHAAAVGCKRQTGRKCILRLLRGQVHVIVEGEKLLRERRIVCQDTHRIVVDMQSVRHRLDDDAFIFIGKNPVKLRRGKLLVEWGVGQYHLGEADASLFYGRTLAENPGDELKLRDVVMILLRLLVGGISDEIQPRHAKPLLIKSIIIKRIIPCHVGHADDGIVGRNRAYMAESKWIVARCNGYLVPVRKFII